MGAGSYFAMMAAGALMGSQQPAKAPNLPPPPPPPQPAQMPNIADLYGGVAGTAQSGGQKGAGQTFLTGASGVDPNALKLNKPTLLGE